MTGIGDNPAETSDLGGEGVSYLSVSSFLRDNSGRMFACVDAKPGLVAPSLGMKLAYVGEENEDRSKETQPEPPLWDRALRHPALDKTI